MEIKTRKLFEETSITVVKVIFEGVICESTDYAGSPEDRDDAGESGDF